MTLEVLAAAAIALMFPAAVKRLLPGSLIAPLLGTVMFGMGLTLKPDDFLRVLKRPWQILAGTAAQFAVMPLLAFALTRVFALDPGIAIGVILVGACPGGTASNVITFLARGDVALSVSLTAVSTLLAPFVTPLVVYALGGAAIEVHPAALCVSILEIVLAPVLLGLFVNRLFERFRRVSPRFAAFNSTLVEGVLPAFSTLTVVVIVAIVVAGSAERLMESFGILFVVVALHNLLGMALGYLVGAALGSPRTLAIEIGMQNSGLACSLAAVHFAAQPLAAVPGAIFSVWHNISGSLFANFVSRSAKPAP